MAAASLRVVRRPKGQPRRALTAASQIIDDPAKAFKSPMAGGTVNNGWQEIAWDMLDMVGELRFYVSWRSNSCGRVRLVASDVGDDGIPTGSTDNQRVIEIVRAIAGGRIGQTQLVKRIVECLTVPGESWVAIITNQDDDTEGWYALTADEISRNPNGVTITLPDKTKHKMVTGTDRMFRIWNPRPRRAWEPDSPVRATLDSLHEIVRTTKTIANASKSRLIGNGIVFLPQEMSLPSTHAPLSANKPDGSPSEPAPSASTPVTQVQEALATVAQTAYDDQDSLAALVPILVGVPGEQIKNVNHLKMGNDVSQMALQTRNEAITRLALGLDVSPERLLGLGGTNHWCVDEQTEALTQRGWVGHGDVRIGDLVLTLNHETGLSEWKPVLDIYRADVVDEPVALIENARLSALTTMSHRWPVQRGKGRCWTTTGDMVEHATQLAEGPRGQRAQRTEKLFVAAPTADLPDQAKYSDALAEMVSWYFTEGSRGVRAGRRTPKVVIYQSRRVNPDNCARIRRALTALFGPESEKFDQGGRYSTPESVARRAQARELHQQGRTVAAIALELAVSNVMVYKYLSREARVRDAVPRWREADGGDDMANFILNSAAAEVILEHAPDRVVTRDFISALTESQLRLFVDITVRADGGMNGSCFELGQKDPARLDAFEYAGILLGYNARRFTQVGIGRTAAGPRMKSIECVSLSPASTFSPRGRHITETKYSGVVWCPTTENRTWLARRSGRTYFTGNSAWAVGDEDVQLHISPVMETICQGIYNAAIKEALEGEGIDSTKYILWYDTSQITTDPDKTSEAQNAWESGAFQVKPYLEAMGLPTDGGYDLATTADLQQWALDIIGRRPELIATYAPLVSQLRDVEFPAPAAALPAAPDPADDEPITDSQNPPATEDDEPAELPAAASAITQVFIARALELAGKRRRSRADYDRLRAVPMHDTHRILGPVTDPAKIPDLIKGWDDTLTADIVDMLGIDGAVFRAQVRRQVRAELMRRSQVVDA